MDQNTNISIQRVISAYLNFRVSVSLVVLTVFFVYKSLTILYHFCGRKTRNPTSLFENTGLFEYKQNDGQV